MTQFIDLSVPVSARGHLRRMPEIQYWDHKIGGTVAAVTGAAVAVHAGVTALKRAKVDHGKGIGKDGSGQ